MLTIKNGIKRYIKYLLRWQASSIILSPCISLYTGTQIFDIRTIQATVLANLIGGLIFYWVDKWLIWKGKDPEPNKN